MTSTTAGVNARSRGMSNDRANRKIKPLEQAGLFFKNFTRHPHLIGSVIPSSRYLVNRVLDGVNWDCTRTVVEYGPGVGTFTRQILVRMRQDATLLAIEVNDEFCAMLREVEDNRLQVVQGSAADVARWMQSLSLGEADFILSGIPYTFFSRELRHSILNASRDVLAKDGVFVSYQYTRAVLPDLREVFGKVQQTFEPINILPARVFYCYR